ncbi:MAG: trypsin-like peptidase domain-containing protein [Clostridia bacterium]|nr:trypsin-like peptidase domain-containing protein [Clostridia bacterium]
MKKKMIALFMSLILLLSFTSCSKTKEVLYISYIDSEGKLIEYCVENSSYNPNDKPLPSDTDNWHYTEWIIQRDGNHITCIAKRTSKQTYLWKDYDGSILYEEILYGEKQPEDKPLPNSDDKWVYTEWDKNTVGNITTYTTSKLPNSNFFKGNVFQIVVSDDKGNPISTGSGFIINKDGWFITNHHVMEDAYSAKAYFDIIDIAEGNRYTELNILGSVYDDSEKDIFIGKLSAYEKIKDYYNSISFTEEYSQGELSYTLGYPNSSVTMQINSGVILEEYSDIYNKVNNIFYILSDSYIAPGSSGGILINENFEVIGITTMGLYADNDKTVYIAGGSIPTFVFKKFLSKLNENNLIPLNQ